MTIPHLKEFLKEGGTIVTIGSSTALADHLGLPLGNHLVTKDAEGRSGRSGAKVLRARLAAASPRGHDSPLAWGMGEQVDVMFLSSPVFKLARRRGQARG